MSQTPHMLGVHSGRQSMGDICSYFLNECIPMGHLSLELLIALDDSYRPFHQLPSSLRVTRLLHIEPHSPIVLVMLFPVRIRLNALCEWSKRTRQYGEVTIMLRLMLLHGNSKSV